MDVPKGRSMADLPDCVLYQILDCVDKKLLFAQVCCSWRSAFYRLQHLLVLPLREVVLAEVARFKQLTSLDVSVGPIQKVNDEFFNDLTRVVEQSSLRLRHLSVHKGDDTTRVSSEALSQLFAATPGLKSLRLLSCVPLGLWMTEKQHPFEIPDSLSKLSCLETLEVTSVKTLPSSFGRGLPKLHSLRLYFLYVQHFPESFATLTALRCLDLDFQDLTLIDCTIQAVLPGLHKLILHAAQLPDSSLDAMGDLPQLRCLFLHGGELSLTPLLRRCSHLRLLRLHSSSIISIPNEALFPLTELRELQLRVPWVDELPSSLGALHRLTKLYLENCNRLRELPNSLSLLHSLQNLEIRFCPSLREFPSGVSSLRSLTNLDLWCLKNLRGPLEELGRVSSLKHVDLSILPELTMLGDSWGSLPKLESMKLMWCDKLRTFPADLGGLRSLRILHLQKLRALLTIPESLTCVTALEEVQVIHCTGLRSVPQGLLSLPNLRSSRDHLECLINKLASP